MIIAPLNGLSLKIVSGSHAVLFQRYYAFVSMVLHPPLRRRLRRNKMFECLSNLCAVKPTPVDPGSSTAFAPLPSDPVSLDRLQVKSLVPLLALPRPSEMAMSVHIVKSRSAT